MGKLSAGMAHEMLNPLNFVIGFSKSARDLVDEFSKASTQEEQSSIITYTKKAIGKISEHADRMAVSVNQVINHVRITSGKKELTDIHQLCNTYLSLAINSMKMQNPDINCQVTKDYPEKIPLVSVNPQEFGRILINILNNSFLAIEEKLLTEKFQPEINIKTTCENNKILISITDNGIGIKKEIIHKIFDHFYTTRTPGKGVGLGLSVANDIVKSYGGKINAESDPGVFTTITFSIPV
jgi:signal transduction histidine kinase